MKLKVPAAPFAAAWRAVWPAVAQNTSLYPLYRSVIIERYDDPDVVHLWASDSSMLLRAVVPTSWDPDDPHVFDPAIWDQLMDADDPVEKVLAHDEFAHGVVLAKTAQKLCKENPHLEVMLTVGRHTPKGGQPALGPDLERLQAIIEVDGLQVDLTAIDGQVPDWRRLEPSLDLGARVKRIGFSLQRLKRLASVPGPDDVVLTFTSSTGAAIADFRSRGGVPQPVRGLLMPNRMLDGPEGPPADADDEDPPDPSATALASEMGDWLAAHGTATVRADLDDDGPTRLHLVTDSDDDGDDDEPEEGDDDSDDEPAE